MRFWTRRSAGKQSTSARKPSSSYVARVRHGLQRIYLRSLNLNLTEPSISWYVTAKSWEQQWPTREGKKLAQQVAKQLPLGMLAWYLGDGKRHKYDLKYKVGKNEEYKPKSLVPEMLFAAGESGYARPLDLLDSKKWQMLKKLRPVQDPVYATLLGKTSWIYYNEDKQVQIARKYS